MRFLIICLLFSLIACGQQSKNKYIPDKKAKLLNDSAMRLIMSSAEDSDYQKAILLLNKTIEIDSNYFLPYSNKLTLQLQHKEYEKALETAKHINTIRPNFPDYYVTVGILYEKTGDTIASYKYFNTALIKYNNILDTMSVMNKSNDFVMMNKAVDLILAGQQLKGNKILEQIYNKQTDNIYKEMINFYMNKSRKEILENFFNPKSTETIVYPTN